MQSPKQPVPMCEIWGIVGLELEVMEIMVWCTSIKSKRHQPVRGPRKVVSAVVLHGQPDVEDEEEQFSERMAAQEQGVDGSEEAQGKCLPRARVFRAQHKRGRVLVVHLVESAVQPRHLVMQRVPYKVLEVKQQQAGHQVSHDLQQVRRLSRHVHLPPVPVQYC